MLLGDSVDDPSAACVGDGDRIFDGIQQSTLGVLIIENVTLCAAGENQISYDVGYLDQRGVFFPLVRNAFSTDVYVLMGDAVGFRLIVRESVAERSYLPVKSKIAVVLHDQGRNVSLSFKVNLSMSHACLLNLSRLRLSMDRYRSSCRLLIPQQRLLRLQPSISHVGAIT